MQRIAEDRRSKHTLHCNLRHKNANASFYRKKRRKNPNLLIERATRYLLEYNFTLRDRAESAAVRVPEEKSAKDKRHLYIRRRLLIHERHGLPRDRGCTCTFRRIIVKLQCDESTCRVKCKQQIQRRVEALCRQPRELFIASSNVISREDPESLSICVFFFNISRAASSCPRASVKMQRR